MFGYFAIVYIRIVIQTFGTLTVFITFLPVSKAFTILFITLNIFTTTGNSRLFFIRIYLVLGGFYWIFLILNKNWNNRIIILIDKILFIHLYLILN